MEFILILFAIAILFVLWLLNAINSDPSIGPETREVPYTEDDTNVWRAAWTRIKSYRK